MNNPISIEVPLYDVSNVAGAAIGPYAPDRGCLSQTIPTSTIYTLPMDLALYPLNENVNQAILCWCVETMPTAATSLIILPINFPTQIASTATRSFHGIQSAQLVNGSAYIFKFTYDDLSTTANRNYLRDYGMIKTAADAPAVISGTSYNIGTRTPIPIAENLGFYCFHDGTTNTGHQTLILRLTWA